jgi:glycosyltransferase involved in cell wall biosynthesis
MISQNQKSKFNQEKIKADNPQWLEELKIKGKFENLGYPILKLHNGEFYKVGNGTKKKFKDIKLEIGRYDVAFFREGPFLPSREGGSNRVYNLAKHIKGLKVCVIHCYRGWSNYKFMEKEKFTTFLLTPRDYYSVSFVYNLLNKIKVKIVDFDYPEIVITHGIKLKTLGFKVVYDAQNVITRLLSEMGLDEKIIKLNRFYEIKACNIADMIHCCSDVDKTSLHKLGVPSTKCITIPTGVDIEKIKFNRNINSNKLFFLGNLFYEPNSSGLLEFVKKVLPLIIKKKNAKLYLIGDIPKNLKNILRSKYSECVVILGPIDDLNKATTSGGIGISFIKIGSGIRVKILNYFALGLPVVSTEVGAEGLNTKNYKNILIANTPRNFANAVLSLQNNPALYMSLSSNARKLVENKYSWYKSSDILERAYIKLLTKD